MYVDYMVPFAINHGGFLFNQLKSNGALGVDIFVFISEMSMWSSLNRNVDWKRFFRRRAQRVLVPYYMFARNKAIKTAKDEYLAFMDSDDYVESNYLQKLYTTAISTKADIVVCNHRRVTENRELLEERPLTGGIKEYTTYEAMDALIDDVIIKSFVWDKLFRREVFQGVSFPVGRYNQDIAIMHEVFGNAKNC